MVSIIKKDQRQMPGWTLFSNELPDHRKEFDVLHIDQSVSYNVSMTQTELLEMRTETPRQWRYSNSKPVITPPRDSVLKIYIVDKKTRERIPLGVTCVNVVATNDEVLLETNCIEEKYIFRVDFFNHNVEKHKNIWTDCFIAIDETEVAEQIKIKYDNGNGYTRYKIMQVHRFNY